MFLFEQDGSFYNTSLTAAQAAASTMAPIIDWNYVNTPPPRHAAGHQEAATARLERYALDAA